MLAFGIHEASFAFAASMILLWVRSFFRRQRALSVPPGPKGIPIIGNVLEYPQENEHLVFAQWSQKYGNIMSTSLFGQRIIILGSIKVATDLLEKRGAIYSDRPRLVMSGELVGWYKAYIGTRRYVEKFYTLEETETRLFLQRTMKNPDALAQELRRFVGSVTVMMTHGYKVQTSPDPVLRLAEKVMNEFCILTTPGSFLVDTFPSLRHVPSWVPGAGWKRLARAWRRNFDEMCDIPHELVKASIEEGKATHNFTTQLLEDPTLDDETIKRATASLYAGGADTSVAALHTLFLVLLLHPEVQQKAQAEIDRVIGTERLPTLADRDELPYVNAVCAESLRWKPVSSMGVPHRVIEEDVYESMLIPKDSIVLANLWQMMHDPETYSDPDKFNPDRFMPSPGKTPELHPRALAFGFGRRVCPGLQLAEMAMFITAATTLSAFNIVNAVEDGVKVVPTGEMKGNGIIMHPQPFKFSIEPRSEKARELILSAE